MAQNTFHELFFFILLAMNSLSFAQCEIPLERSQNCDQQDGHPAILNFLLFSVSFPFYHGSYKTPFLRVCVRLVRYDWVLSFLQQGGFFIVCFHSDFFLPFPILPFSGYVLRQCIFDTLHIFFLCTFHRKCHAISILFLCCEFGTLSGYTFEEFAGKHACRKCNYFYFKCKFEKISSKTISLKFLYFLS